MKIFPAEFDGQSIRRVYDEATEIWWFSVIDVVQALTDSENARDYWFKMKLRVKLEDGAELSTFCRQLKMLAADGKQRLTRRAVGRGEHRDLRSAGAAGRCGPGPEGLSKEVRRLSCRR